MKTLIGQILLWAGFLAGSFAVVRDTSLNRQLGLDIRPATDDEAPGVYVEKVTSWADSDIAAGDQLMAMGDTSVESPDDVTRFLGSVAADSETVVKVLRNGQTLTATRVVPSPWQTINWLWYLSAAGVGLVGVGLLWADRKHKSQAVGHEASGIRELAANLDTLVAELEDLLKQHSKQRPRQTLEFIEERLYDPLRQFADGRDTITREFGMEVFAEVMSDFASGERCVNRAWSASADGYVDEARASLESALEFQRHAQTALNSRLKNLK